jgi:DNA-binding CsgD family transcriptional regulator
MKQPILSPFCDNDAFLELDKDRHPLWREAYVRNDLVHVSITVLSRALDNASFVAVIRSGSQGPFCDEDFKMLTLAGSSWKTSVSVAAAVRSEVACGTTSALHLAHLTGFILDAQGCVRLATASAEVLLQKYVTINRQHRLEIGPPRRDAIQNAVDLCRLTGAPSIIEARISDKNALRFMVSPLPVSRTDFLFGPAILVICKIVRLRPNYTHAESAVADELRSGKSLSEIAVIRHTSLETIKSQSKSIYAKASVSGQIELIMEFIDSGASPINVAI